MNEQQFIHLVEKLFELFAITKILCQTLHADLSHQHHVQWRRVLNS